MRIPDDEDFGSSDFSDSEQIKEVAVRVIRSKLGYLDDGDLLIDYRWKRKGGTSGGNDVMGKCVKLSGLARHLSLGAHFCIWLAADHCRDHKYNDRQLEALVFHELKHIEIVEPEDGDDAPSYRTVGHEVEMFYDELREYGAWDNSLTQLVDTVRQLVLPMDVGQSGDVADGVNKIARDFVRDTFRSDGIESISFSASHNGEPIGETVTITREDANRIKARTQLAT